MRHAARNLLIHGLFVLTAGMLLGFVYMVFLVGALDLRPLPLNVQIAMPGTEHGWRVAHVGSLINGVFAVALAFALDKAGLEPRARAWAGRLIIFAIWVNVLFYILANFAPNRALSWNANQYGEASAAGMIAFVPAVFGTLSAVVGVVMILRGVLRSRAEGDVAD